MDDSELEAALSRLAEARSDQEAWLILYNRLWPYVVATNNHLLPNDTRNDSTSIEDLSQEVFFRLVKYCDFNNLTHPNVLRAYLRSICRSVCLDYRLKAHAKAEVALPLNAEVPSIDTHILSHMESESLISEILESLDATDRQVALMLLEGESLASMVEKTGMRYGTLAVRMHRLKSKISKYLSKQ